MYDNMIEDIENLYETNKFGYKYVRYDRKPKEDLVNYYKNNFNINTDCHYSCITCQIHQINKYKVDLDLKNEKLIAATGKGLEKWFPVKCEFIKKGLPNSFFEKLEQLKKKGIDERRAKRLLLASIDPAAWAETMFGFDDDTKELPDISRHWYLRWYQKLIVRCTANRIVLRWGRRSGKSAISTLWMINKIFNYKVFKGINPETGEDILGGPAIAIVTPFQSQVSNLFEELERFIKSNKELEKQVVPRGSKLYRQTPPLLMEFKNGASIKGFVTGSNNKEDGSGGGAIRGLTADIVYLDEMDMIPESIYKKVIDPLKLSKPHTYFIGSSTPIGKKATFYKWSLEDMNYKESYVPSTALPHWDIVEEEAMNESTQDSFRSEYMADFITDSYGAFKNQYIISARTNYSYQDTNSYEFWKQKFNEDFSKFRICIGIDWNKKIGTEYSVTAWSPISGDFWVLENIVLPPSQYSGQAYKEMLKTLNYKWNPHYIYADEGHGHFLIEDLQVESAYAEDERGLSPFLKATAELGKKMKSVNFSSNIKLYNPASGTYFEKYAKSFLVENAVQIFEREKIHFDESDQTLIRQLGNFIEIKKQDNGRIVYGMENELIGDHRLDAMMLALAGLVIEESLYSPNLSTETGTFLKEKRDEEKETFVSAIQQATELASLIKRQKTNAHFQGIVLQRGSTKEQEYSNWKEKQWREGLTNQTRSSRIPIDEEKASKGFFSKRGLAEYVETSPGEDKEENWKYHTPIKIAPIKRGNHIRKTTF